MIWRCSGFGGEFSRSGGLGYALDGSIGQIAIAKTDKKTLIILSVAR
jgi:hypothetical protein